MVKALVQFADMTCSLICCQILITRTHQQIRLLKMTPIKWLSVYLSACVCWKRTARDQSGFFINDIFQMHHWSWNVNLISPQRALKSLLQISNHSGVLCHSGLRPSGRSGWGITSTAFRHCGRLTSHQENNGCTHRSQSGWSHPTALALWDGCSLLQFLRDKIKQKLFFIQIIICFRFLWSMCIFTHGPFYLQKEIFLDG